METGRSPMFVRHFSRLHIIDQWREAKAIGAMLSDHGTNIDKYRQCLVDLSLSLSLLSLIHI